MKITDQFASAFPIVLGILATALTASTSTLLRGTVTDPNGAVIGEATVTLSSAENGFKRQVLTGATGEYQFLRRARHL